MTTAMTHANPTRAHPTFASADIPAGGGGGWRNTGRGGGCAAAGGRVGEAWLPHQRGSATGSGRAAGGAGLALAGRLADGAGGADSSGTTGVGISIRCPQALHITARPASSLDTF